MAWAFSVFPFLASSAGANAAAQPPGSANLVFPAGHHHGFLHNISPSPRYFGLFYISALFSTLCISLSLHLHLHPRPNPRPSHPFIPPLFSSHLISRNNNTRPYSNSPFPPSNLLPAYSPTTQHNTETAEDQNESDMSYGYNKSVPSLRSTFASSQQARLA